MFVSHSQQHWLWKGQQLHYREHGLAPGGYAATARAWKRLEMGRWYDSSRSEQHFVFLPFCNFFIKKWNSDVLVNSRFPLRLVSVCAVWVFFYEIPDVSFCHSTFLSSPPTSWPLVDSCKPQPACVNVHVPISRAVSARQRLYTLSRLYSFSESSQSHNRSALGTFCGDSVDRILNGIFSLRTLRTGCCCMCLP